MLLNACATVESTVSVEGRIAEKAEIFYAADETTRENLRKERVQPGYSPDLVYIALGKPAEELVSRMKSESGEPRTMRWTYRWSTEQTSIPYGYLRVPRMNAEGEVRETVERYEGVVKGEGNERKFMRTRTRIVWFENGRVVKVEDK